ncbi:hypothetical protein F4861DRAFT_68323 [Xylaria intraflava]|nr:hypothetical protein F4861DRAFT_68323 [Xylaria intraflava]
MTDTNDIPACARGYGTNTTTFSTPEANETYSPGNMAAFRWYGGVVPNDTMPNKTLALFLSSLQDESYSYDIADNVTIPFAGKAADYPAYWSYMLGIDCPVTELSYFWPIPKDFTPALTTNFEYVLIVKTIVTEAWSIVQSPPIRIIASLPPSASTSSKSQSSSTAAPTSSKTQEASGATSSPIRLSSSSLSPGAKAGIAVGSVIGGVGLILLGFWLFFKNRRKGTPSKEAAARKSLMTTPEDGGIAQLETVEKAELDTQPPPKPELDGQQMARECGGEALYELDAASPVREHSVQEHPAQEHPAQEHPAQERDPDRPATGLSG